MKTLITATALTATALFAIEASADPTREFVNYYLDKASEAVSLLANHNCQPALDYIEAVEPAEINLLQQLVAEKPPSDALSNRLAHFLEDGVANAVFMEQNGSICAYYLGRAYGAVEGAQMGLEADREAFR